MILPGPPEALASLPGHPRQLGRKQTNIASGPSLAVEDLLYRTRTHSYGRASTCSGLPGWCNKMRYHISVQWWQMVLGQAPKLPPNFVNSVTEGQKQGTHMNMWDLIRPRTIGQPFHPKCRNILATLTSRVPNRANEQSIFATTPKLHFHLCLLALVQRLIGFPVAESCTPANNVIHKWSAVLSPS